MRTTWWRPEPMISPVFEPRDGETEWVIVDGRRVGYLYRMWQHCLACTDTKSRCFSDETKAVRWLAAQAPKEPAR
jgi:hypothetical protein